MILCARSTLRSREQSKKRGTCESTVKITKSLRLSNVTDIYLRNSWGAQRFVGFFPLYSLRVLIGWVYKRWSHDRSRHTTSESDTRPGTSYHKKDPSSVLFGSVTQKQTDLEAHYFIWSCENQWRIWVERNVERSALLFFFGGGGGGYKWITAVWNSTVLWACTRQ